jgi:hypothetical protein
MAEKQAHLNGAYYGPAIPPQQNYHSHGRGSGCGCGCCLLSCLLKIIVTTVVVLGLAILIFWLVVRPNKVKFHVTEATLSEFNITNNNLHYNLALNITVRNPNKKMGIYYDRIEARPRYEDQRFDSKFLTPFYQGHKNTSFMTASFQGEQLILLAGDELVDYNQEKGSGLFSIDLTLYLKIRFKIGDIKIGKFKPKIQCDLKVPLNNTAGIFRRTECDWDY